MDDETIEKEEARLRQLKHARKIREDEIRRFQQQKKEYERSHWINAESEQTDSEDSSATDSSKSSKSQESFGEDVDTDDVIDVGSKPADEESDKPSDSEDEPAKNGPARHHTDPYAHHIDPYFEDDEGLGFHFEQPTHEYLRDFYANKQQPVNSS